MNRKEWLKAYRTDKTAVWIKCLLTNGENIFFKEFDQWLTLIEKCKSEGLFLVKFNFQFRSHEVKVDVSDCDGFYFIRSKKGMIGGDNLREYYTTGKVVGDKIYKTMWNIPELIEEETNCDPVTSSFTEAILYDQTSENRQK